MKTVEGNWNDVVQPMTRYVCLEKRYGADNRPPMIWDGSRLLKTGGGMYLLEGFGKVANANQ